MIFSLIYLLLAILGLSFLIFIHELGHYFMARRVGMKVETFSIGFGRSIFSWMRDGVEWKVGWLPFGGYVKIAGMEGENDDDIYNTPGGFFNKSPWDRIKVAIMGPLANLVLGLLIFTFIWLGGGRQESFSEFTSKIGWVDPQSELYAHGVRPGDEVISYDGHAFEGGKDHIYAAMTDPEGVTINGNKVNYADGSKQPFEYTIKPYSHPNSTDKEILTTGILKSANYMIYQPSTEGTENSMMEVSPLKNSGIQPGDRVVWVDGERIFSLAQVNQILNDGKVLLTVQRGDQKFLARVPRFPIQEYKMDPQFREELVDWQYESQLNGVKFQQLLMIPYNLNNDGVVEESYKFIDAEKEPEAFPKNLYSSLDNPLQKGDKIIAVDGTPTKQSFQILYQLQRHRVLVIVEKDAGGAKPVLWNDADAAFDQEINSADLQKLALAVGTADSVTSAGNLKLLAPVTPISLGDWMAAIEKQNPLAIDQSAAKAQPVSNEAASQLMLGLPGIQDRKVQYNPGPFTQFFQVVDQIWRMLGALGSGSMNMKFMAGPVGIIQMVHNQWMMSFNDALYWLGVISVNLGILNLLPIPVLDGGTILFCLVELVSGRKIHPKALEKAIVPFAAMLICVFVYITYYDLTRIFGGFFH